MPARPLSRRLLFLALAACGVVLAAWAHWPARDPGERADRVVVRKGTRVLELWAGERLLARYPISLGRTPLGHKQREGDGRTPEGRYVLDWRNQRSAFHRSLHVSYPSVADTAAAAARGEPPGGLIMVHGLPNGFGWMGRAHRFVDWTDGCIAVTNDEMQRIWNAVADGTPIEIVP